jgi:hypothetical protein
MKIYTLGPENTNCELAAKTWRRQNCGDAEIVLCPSLENGVERLFDDQGDAVLISCVVYPKLHELVFHNTDRLRFSDFFLMNTMDMVLACNPEVNDGLLATHPAPESLGPQELKRIFANSNAEAAIFCRNGKAGHCITTITACEKQQLTLVKNYGEIPMGFAVHIKK